MKCLKILGISLIIFILIFIFMNHVGAQSEKEISRSVLVATNQSTQNSLENQYGVNNFVISNFEADYYLDKDAEGRSTLRVVETITADFPSTPQNKGLVREIPIKYQNHSLSFKFISLQRNGRIEPIYANYDKGDFRVIETGTDEYVLGPQTYTLTYTLRDVMHYFADVNRDELYWNTNGTAWRVPITNLTARVYMSDDIRSRFTGDMACYRGASGSTDRCEILQTDTGFIASTANLSQQENLTFAIGFESNTFGTYQKTFGEKAAARYFLSLAGAFFISSGSLIVLYRRFAFLKNRRREITTIIPEYVPLQDVSVSVSANVLGYSRPVVIAQLMDLAVRGYVQIIEVKQKTFWEKAEFGIKIIRDITELKEEEKEILDDMLGGFPKKGDYLNLEDLTESRGFLIRSQDNEEKLKRLVEQYGLREKNEEATVWFRKVAKIFLGCGIITLNPVLFIVSIFAYHLGGTLRPLTNKGLALSQYLQGLKMYIKVAEKDRIKMLQSPDGVEKIGSDITGDSGKLLKLYEQTLPYAILFGQEKEWNKQLGHYYESTHTTPTWYSGKSGIMNTVVFTNMMSSFSSSMSSVSGSSLGGSGGGGFSGGGGGGGGGGGR